MVATYCLLSALPLAFAQFPDDETEYAGSDEVGKRAKLEDYPFLVQIEVKVEGTGETSDSESIPCVGSYIKPKWVLTAAVCLKHFRNRSGKPKIVPDSNVQCKMGLTSAEEEQEAEANVKSAKIYVHSGFKIIPKYENDYSFGHASFNNIGLVHLEKAFTLSSTIGTIALPTSPVDYGGKATVVGYDTLLGEGFLNATLRALTAPIWPKNKCREKTNSSTKICIGDDGVDELQQLEYDMGGPLIYNHMIIGVATPRMDLQFQYGEYEDVYAHKDWINSIIKKDTSCCYRSPKINILNLLIVCLIKFV